MRRLPWYLLMFVWGALFVVGTPGLERTWRLLSLASSVVPLLAAGYAQRGPSLRGGLALALGVGCLFAWAVLHGRAESLARSEDAWVSGRVAIQAFGAYLSLFALCKQWWPRFGVGFALLLDGSVGFLPHWGVLFPRLHVVALLSKQSAHFAQAFQSGAFLWAMSLVLGGGVFLRGGFRGTPR